jgi:hypothetical protein
MQEKGKKRHSETRLFVAFHFIEETVESAGCSNRL